MIAAGFGGNCCVNIAELFSQLNKRRDDAQQTSKKKANDAKIIFPFTDVQTFFAEGLVGKAVVVQMMTLNANAECPADPAVLDKAIQDGYEFLAEYVPGLHIAVAAAKSSDNIGKLVIARCEALLCLFQNAVNKPHVTRFSGLLQWGLVARRIILCLIPTLCAAIPFHGGWLGSTGFGF